MIKHLLFLTFIVISIETLKAQDSTLHYKEAYEQIDSMLNGKTALNFKKAVFAVENAYLDNKLNYSDFDNEIKVLFSLAEIIKNTHPIEYTDSDKDIIESNASIFRVITDTVPIFIDSTNVLVHFPFNYNFDDMLGRDDWSNTFVSKLLVTQKGNCHSMPFLYKILAEEMNVPAYLAFAPNHIYIKLRCDKTGWYNTELTSATFPVDAWIMASGYITIDAVRNGLYMDTLSLQQSVAYCLLDLAQGYQRKFGKNNPDFIIKSCNTVLNFIPVNVNTMITKAEAQKSYIELVMKEKKVKTHQELFTDNTIKTIYDDMEQTYVKLYQLGYRRMPEEMYMKWMGLLNNEPEKFSNDKLMFKFENR